MAGDQSSHPGVSRYGNAPSNSYAASMVAKSLAPSNCEDAQWAGDCPLGHRCTLKTEAHRRPRRTGSGGGPSVRAHRVRPQESWMQPGSLQEGPGLRSPRKGDTGRCAQPNGEREQEVAD